MKIDELSIYFVFLPFSILCRYARLAIYYFFFLRCKNNKEAKRAREFFYREIKR